MNKSINKKIYFRMITGLLVGLLLGACTEQDSVSKSQENDTASEIATTKDGSNMEQSSGDELLDMARTIFQALPSQEEVNAKRPITDAQVELGKKLYFDNRLSKNGNQSCNSCHNVAKAGVDNLQFSPGSEFALGGRNAPTVFNAALQASQFWDGRAKDLKEQAGGPLLNPVEMGLPDEQAAIDRVQSIPEYVQEFTQAFPNAPEVSFDNITFAISAYEQTLLTPSPWDDYLKGNINALTEQQKVGLKKFIDYACVTCHNGVNLGGNSFQKFGLVDGPYWKFTGSSQQDNGRFQVTQAEDDKFVFRVPDLRNIADTYPYFHDGSVWSLKKSIEIMGQAQLGQKLPEQDINDMAAFLESLSGEVSKDARLLPQLPRSGVDTPKPALSK